MTLYTERDLIRHGIASFIKQYDGKPESYDKDGSRCAALKKLDPETATADEVEEITGGGGWVVQRCSECGQNTRMYVQVGQEPDYDSMTAYLCLPCVDMLDQLVSAYRNSGRPAAT